MNRQNTKILAFFSEECASNYLEQNNWVILYRNWKNKVGEIDIIAKEQHKNLIAFIEVRSKISSAYLAPQLSVTIKKQKKLIQIAKNWLKENYIKEMNYSFDIIAITLDSDFPKIKHIRNAFQAPDLLI